MKQRVALLASIFATLTLLCVAGKAVFVGLNGAAYAGLTAAEFFSVIAHGLPMDLSVAGYLSVIPALLLTGSIFARGRALRIVGRVLLGVLVVEAALLALAIAADAMLYPHWGFKLDTTPLFYLFSSPDAAAASGGFGSGVLLAVMLWAIFAAALWLPLRLIGLSPAGRRGATAATMCALTALLFLPIRGGLTVSTMNLSRAYFSSSTRLNHAAVNPLFSFLYSASHQSRFDRQFHWFDDTEASRITAGGADIYAGDTIAAPELSTDRPDICLVILESFSTHLMPSAGGAPVAMRLDSIAAGGLFFTDCYASSYRTDRALPAILSGYPGQPTTSIMKFVEKAERLPSFPAIMRSAGFDASYYYGGDINFTSMNAYLVSAGFGRIVSDKDFPLTERISKWGAPDHLVLRRHLDDLRADAANPRPRLTVVQTSSSHEPYDVPYRSRHADPRLNAFAYADSALGAWFGELSRSPRWDRTLVVITADHFGLWPDTLTSQAARHRIPLIITGGALRSGPRRIDATVGQTDIAATILRLAGIKPDEHLFPFSNDIFDPSRPRIAFFSDYEHASAATRDGTATVALTTDSDVEGTPAMTRYVRAYLQNLYRDLQNR